MAGYAVKQNTDVIGLVPLNVRLSSYCRHRA